MGLVCSKETPVLDLHRINIHDVVYKYKVYVISCKNDYAYVGMTEGNIEDEFLKHEGGLIPWTLVHKPDSIKLHKSFQDECDAKVEETAKTLKLMHLKGIDKVRGGRYPNYLLNKFQTLCLKSELAHNESLCFNCLEKGHYTKNCPLSLSPQL